MFDIHAYGEAVLEGISGTVKEPQEGDQDEAEAPLFEDILSSRLQSLHVESTPDKSHPETMDRYEVCRLFLATLQLANNWNVELCHEDHQGDLRVRPKCDILANERLKSYLAPSVQHQKDEDSYRNTDKVQPKKKKLKAMPVLGQENIAIN